MFLLIKFNQKGFVEKNYNYNTKYKIKIKKTQNKHRLWKIICKIGNTGNCKKKLVQIIIHRNKNCNINTHFKCKSPCNMKTSMQH